MTNREKFEAEKIDFSKVIEKFNESGMQSFDEFLNKQACKYKPGDLVVLELNSYSKDGYWKHNVVLEILGIGKKDSGSGKLENYEVKFLTPAEPNIKIGHVTWYPIYTIDKESHLY